MVQFLQILQKTKAFGALVQLVDDDKGGKVLRLFKLLRGEPTEEKKKVLNGACMAVVMTRRMPGYENDHDNPNAIHQPNTTETFLKHVFRLMREQGIQYGQADIKNLPGSYAAYLAKQWQGILKLRTDFGNKPNQATTVMDDVEKLANADPPLRPFDDFDDLLSMVLWSVSKVLTFRAGLEVCCARSSRVLSLVFLCLVACIMSFMLQSCGMVYVCVSFFCSFMLHVDVFLRLASCKMLHLVLVLHRDVLSSRRSCLFVLSYCVSQRVVALSRDVNVTRHGLSCLRVA
jgi:hypothetical protein